MSIIRAILITHNHMLKKFIWNFSSSIDNHWVWMKKYRVLLIECGNFLVEHQFLLLFLHTETSHVRLGTREGHDWMQTGAMNACIGRTHQQQTSLPATTRMYRMQLDNSLRRPAIQSAYKLLRLLFQWLSDGFYMYKLSGFQDKSLQFPSTHKTKQSV